MTTYKDIRTAVIGRIAANWNATPVQYAATQYTPPAGAAYIQPRLIFATAEQASMGPGGHNRIRGDLHTNVFIPSGHGDDEAMEYCDNLRALFPRGLMLSAGARVVRFETPEVQPPLEETEWHQVPVICPFWLDEVPE
jgi:Bacteriophage related domain of unknown function